MFTKQMHKIIVEKQELNKKRTIRSSDKIIAEQKGLFNRTIWNKKWQHIKNAEKQRLNEWVDAKDVKEKKRLADRYTTEAKDYMKLFNSMLGHALIVDNRVGFDSLGEFIDFKKPLEPPEASIPDEPCETDPEFVPDLNMMEKLLPAKKQKKIEELKEKYQECHLQWEEETRNIENKRQIDIKKYQRELENWEKEKKEILDAIASRNEELLNGNPEAIVDIVDLVLANSNYPHSFPQDYDLDYDATKKRLVVQYLFPSLDAFNIITQYKYNKKKDKLDEVYESNNSIKTLYDETLYQIAIRTVYEIFSCDQNDHIENIVFTGWVKIEGDTKNEVKEMKICVMSLVADRKIYGAINFGRKNAKSIFSKFDGVVKGNLSKLNPVTPYLKIQLED